MKQLTSTRLAAAAAVAIGALAAAGGAQAAGFVTTAPIFAPTTELITFDGYDGLLYETAAYPTGLYLDSDRDVLLTTSNGGAVVGAFEQDLAGNGLWGARFASTPTGSGNFLSAITTLTFSFGADGPQARVGAFFNLSQPFSGPKANTITLEALDASNVVLETVTFSVDSASDGYNEGVFAGFYRNQADIENFRVSFTGGGSLVMDELHLSFVPVPEPGTYALLASGLGLVGWVARRRRQAR